MRSERPGLASPFPFPLLRPRFGLPAAVTAAASRSTERALLSYVHDTADLQQENGGGAASPTAGGDGASPAGRAANLFPLFVIDYLSKRHGLRPIVEKMAWELASDEGKASFSPKFLLSLIDDTFSKAQTDTYRAFRLLQSDMGKIFFKPIGPNEYKAKAAKAVRTSKENWCRSLEAEQEWCFV